VAELTKRETKLIQYLNEAYGKEKELETALQAHIAMTTRAPYKKRLRQHLSETKRHAREVERRIKRLGGVPEVVALPGPEAISQGASAAVELGSRALAAAKGPLHAIRGTGEQEKMLKNAKSEYSEEHEEIATYTAIEVLAGSLGDGETAKLAKAIRREEERMASFLARLIPALTRAVVQEEIPSAERRAVPSGRKPAATARSKRAAATRRASPSGAKRTTVKRVKADAASNGAGRASTRGAGAKRASGKRSKPVSPARTSRRVGAGK
jgi:ferritin-like metal-binding protein YciE